MWGFHINQLDVFTEANGNRKTTVWTKTGQQKDMWLSGEVDVSLEAGDRVG